MHVISAGAWIGIDVVLVVVVFTALLTDDPRTAGLSLQTLELFAIWPLLAAGLVCLASGLLLGLGSKYGLVRYSWVRLRCSSRGVGSTIGDGASDPSPGGTVGGYCAMTTR